MVTADGFLPLPAHALELLPPGTLVRLELDDGEYRLRVEGDQHERACCWRRSRCATAGCVAVAPLSLTVPGGRMLAVTGPSGAGKTSLLWAMAGALEPDRGHASQVDGAPVGGRPEAAARGDRRRAAGQRAGRGAHGLREHRGAAAGRRRVPGEARRPSAGGADGRRARGVGRAPGRGALRWPAAAGRGGPRAGGARRRCCWPTSRPATSTAATARWCSPRCGPLPTAAPRGAGHPRPGGRRRRRRRAGARHAARRPGCGGSTGPRCRPGSRELHRRAEPAVGGASRTAAPGPATGRRSAPGRWPRRPSG